MNHSARATDHTTAPSAAPGTDREQSTPTPATGADLVLAEVARLANELCEHLSDSQWRTAARIRELAETALLTAGDR
ncbi:hypothetical protein ACFXKR_32285 [Streptomyces violascens]|uniref:hypothetical protein n=1 Tax=Streptomyces violascens TaxID=67381 RepID=UPI003675C659